MDSDIESFYPVTSTNQNNYVYECRICNAGFADVQELFTHTEEHAGKSSAHTTSDNDYEEDDKPFSCIECNEKFDSYEKMVFHMKSHSKENDSILSIISQDENVGADEEFHYESDNSDLDEAEREVLKESLLNQLVEEFEEKSDAVNVVSEASSANLVAMSLTTLECQFCSKKFSKKDNIKKHIRIHTGEKPYTCPYCTKRFACPSTRKKHIRVHTGEKPYYCALCGYRFSQSPSLKHHALNLHGVTDPQLYVGKRDGTPRLKNFTALDVRKTATRYVARKKSRSSKQSHSASSFRERLRKGQQVKYCGRCKMNFDSWDQYEKHLTEHNEEQQLHICTTCKKHFTHHSDLESHLKTCVGPLFSCSYCPKTFSRGSSLTRHSHVHTGGRPYRCNICKWIFPELATLTKHLKRIHKSAWTGQLKNKAETVEINRTFKIKTDHDSEKGEGWEFDENDDASNQEGEDSDDTIDDESLICRYCRKPFSSHSLLAEHEKTHTRNKPFECTTCGRCFGYKSHLNRHILIHTGEKPFKCWLCKMRFRQNVSLKSHIRVHHKGVSFASQPKKTKPQRSASNKKAARSSKIPSQPPASEVPANGKRSLYKCGICRKSFRYYSTFTRHKQSHGSSNTLKCSACGKMFTRRNALIEHMRIHTGEKPCICSHCGNRYRYQSHLARHLRMNECGKLDFEDEAEDNEAEEESCEVEKESCEVEKKVFKQEDEIVVDDNSELESYENFLAEKREGVLMVFDPQSIDDDGFSGDASVSGKMDDLDDWIEEAGDSDDELSDEDIQMEDDSDPPYMPFSPRSRSNRKVAIANEGLVSSKMMQQFVEGDKCIFCNKTFICRSDMTRHLRTHTGEKPFLCNTCGSRFTQKKSLIEHSRTHTGEKPHFCRMCGLNFRYRSHLGRHLRRVHDTSIMAYMGADIKGQSEYSCIACQKEFTTLDYLRQHLESVHQIGEDSNIADEVETKHSPQISNEETVKFEDALAVEKTDEDLADKFSYDVSGENLSFKCEFCDFSCSDYSSWLKHLSAHSLNDCNDLS